MACAMRAGALTAATLAIVSCVSVTNFNTACTLEPGASAAGVGGSVELAGDGDPLWWVGLRARRGIAEGIDIGVGVQVPGLVFADAAEIDDPLGTFGELLIASTAVVDAKLRVLESPVSIAAQPALVGDGSGFGGALTAIVSKRLWIIEPTLAYRIQAHTPFSVDRHLDPPHRMVLLHHFFFGIPVTWGRVRFFPEATLIIGNWEYGPSFAGGLALDLEIP